MPASRWTAPTWSRARQGARPGTIVTTVGSGAPSGRRRPAAAGTSTWSRSRPTAPSRRRPSG
eukprot:9990740-Lingulodinium_polyedra.AAC.1